MSAPSLRRLGGYWISVWAGGLLFFFQGRLLFGSVFHGFIGLRDAYDRREPFVFPLSKFPLC